MILGAATHAKFRTALKRLMDSDRSMAGLSARGLKFARQVFLAILTPLIGQLKRLATALQETTPMLQVRESASDPLAAPNTPTNIENATWPDPCVGQSSLVTPLIELAERILALVVLIALLPLLLLIALLIRLDSTGPALFIQRRVARLPANWDLKSEPDEGCVPTFPIFKFRTYYHRSEAMAPGRSTFEFDDADIGQVQLQLKHDPRITRVGAFLRRTSLDELPNLINIVRGEMRIIGPRPEVREMVRYYTPSQMAKFLVKPGITGMAQVNGRGKLNFKETLDFDLWYVRNRSFIVDLRIILKTVRVVLTGDGSY